MMYKYLLIEIESFLSEIESRLNAAKESTNNALQVVKKWEEEIDILIAKRNECLSFINKHKQEKNNGKD